MSPKISVLLPTKNGEAYIEEAIHSCLNQTYEDWELIIVDDGSSDNTNHIINDFRQRDPRISCYRINQPHKLPGAMNFASALATGKYHFWLCDDDRLLPDAFEALVVPMKKLPEVGLVYADHWMIDESGKRTRIIEREPYHYLLSCNVVSICRLYRASLFNTVGGFETDLFLSEDYSFWLRAAGHVKFEHLPQPLMEYRFRPGNLTSSVLPACHRAGIRAVARHFDTPRNIPPEWRQQAALRIAREAWKLGQRKIAVRFALRMPFISPTGLARALGRKLAGKSFLPPAPSGVPSRQKT